jgi:hypothetical protein
MEQNEAEEDNVNCDYNGNVANSGKFFWDFIASNYV